MVWGIPVRETAATPLRLLLLDAKVNPQLVESSNLLRTVAVKNYLPLKLENYVQRLHSLSLSLSLLFTLYLLYSFYVMLSLFNTLNKYNYYLHTKKHMLTCIKNHTNTCTKIGSILDIMSVSVSLSHNAPCVTYYTKKYIHTTKVCFSTYLSLYDSHTKYVYFSQYLFLFNIPCFTYYQCDQIGRFIELGVTFNFGNN